MKYEEVLNSKSSATKISLDELYSIITSPSQQYLKYTGDERTIHVENHIIEGENIYLDDTLNISYRLSFQDCFFATESIFFIIGMRCENYLTFEKCYFPNGIYITDGVFSKEVTLKLIYAPTIHIIGGTFQEITLSGYDIKDIWLSGGSFETFDMAKYVGGEDLGNLTIFSKANEFGDITIKNKSFAKVYIHGSNKDSIYSFHNIKCDNFTISNFNNAGIMNICGIQPRSETSIEKYFQIINSNLGKAEFYRAYFSMFNEFIIIDSFISDCLFIECRWASNIRSLYGPDHNSFKKSLENKRKITTVELYAIKEAYRQLKISMNKHSDKIQEAKFYSKEMNIHNQLLQWTWPWKNIFWDKVILHWSKIFSDYGQSFIRPVFFLLAGHLILFIVALISGGFEPLHLSISDPTKAGFAAAFEKYFIYINPLRRLEISLSGYLVLLDLIMRIWSSYMLYNIIRASRRFIS